MKKIFTLVILLSMGITQIYAQACIECASTIASGNKASSIGYGTTASGLASFAGGISSVASGDYSFAFGNTAKALNDYGIALGSYAQVFASDGIAIGSNLTSNAANSYVFGQYLTSTGTNSLTLGIGSSNLKPLVNSKNNSIMFGVTDKPSLTIVKPTPNAPVGYLGIGTDDPKEMAHVVGKLLIDRTVETESSLQFKHAITTKGEPGNPQDTLIIGFAQYCWDIYSNIYGLKFNILEKSSGRSEQRVVMSSAGSVGIGSAITTPQAKLHVDSKILAEGDITTLTKFRLAPEYNSTSDYWEIKRTNTGLKYTYQDIRPRDVLFIGNDGSIGIGKNTPQATLDVDGLVRASSAKVTGLLCANEVRVSLSGLPCWPDFVFGKNYKLPSLAEVEQFITENQHLPNVPSAAEVETNGVALGEMNALLLQKVEELTLYIIQMEKRLAELESKKNND